MIDDYTGIHNTVFLSFGIVYIQCRIYINDVRGGNRD